MIGILFCVNIYGQTNNLISVDRDSLFKVFVNYEGCKLSMVALSADKINLTELVKTRESQIAVYDSVLKVYDEKILPGWIQKDSLRLMQIDNLNKQIKSTGRKKLITGGVVGSLIVSLIAIL